MGANVRFFSLFLLIFCMFRCIQADSNCLNPNHRKGYCISIDECPVLKELNAQALSDDQRRFLDESACTDGFGHPPLVCCTDDIHFQFSERIADVTADLNVNSDLLPTLSECGDQPSGSKIYSGKETELDEFPWMALLNYGDDKTPKFFCGGSLINPRYVLTAAHCVVEKELQSVRLGEYDTSKFVDCIESDCADPFIDVNVDEMIVHPNYNPKSLHRHNDIAMLRLNSDITYTPFISPICLPSLLDLNRNDAGTNLVAVGWGQTLQEKRSKIKLKISLPVFGQNECQRAYKRTKVFLVDSQLCAGGKYIEDTCAGDSGGPLMFFRGKWAIEGIVSFSRGCGLENLPGIYTRVSEYEYWIRMNLKP